MKKVLALLLLLPFSLCYAKQKDDYGNFSDLPMAVMLHEEKQCIYEADGYKVYAYINYGKLYVSFDAGVVPFTLKLASPNKQVWADIENEHNELHFDKRGNRWIPKLYKNGKLIKSGSTTEIDCSPPFDI